MARDVLVFVAYSVDHLDTRRSVTDYQCRFYTISSLVDLASVPYRPAQVSCPSCIMPFARRRFIRRVGFLVDAVNVQLTSTIAVNRYLRDRCRWSKTKRNISYNHGNGRKARCQAPLAVWEDRRDDLRSSISTPWGRCRTCSAQKFTLLAR